MADNNFRSYRTLDPNSARARETANDPLADLARLIGRGDRHTETTTRDPRYSRQPADTGAAGEVWSDEDYAAPDRRLSRQEDRIQHYDDRAQRYDDRAQHYDEAPQYEDHPSAQPASQASYGSQDHGRYADEEQGNARFFSGPAARFNGFSDDDDAYPSPEPPAIPERAVPAYASDEYETDPPAHETYDGYAPDDYDDESPAPRRRGGLVVVMAVLGLVVVGTAGAFAYRAMFGGSMLPTLPPIIKANVGPNKIVPDAQASNNATPGGAAPSGQGEQLVPREEQPVAMEPPKTAARVVSTVPIVTGQGGPAVANAESEGIWPAPPSTASLPPPPPPMAAAPSQASSAASGSAETKKIHTVIIRSDQSGGADGAAQAAPAARATARAAAAPAPARPSAGAGGSNAPMSIAPGAQGDAAPTPPARTRVAAAPPAAAPVALANPAPASAAAAAPASGGYAVQVTSQRSEGDAQTAYRELQAKYPNQLGGREPIIRRADLGEKGVYFRALVGPFASSEQASGLCSGLKAAGGDCLVQKN
jgi:SPOR domain